MAKQADSATQVVIEAPRIAVLNLTIRGTAPYVQHKFSAKARQIMIDRQRQGDKAKKVSKKEPKNFESAYEEAKHISRQGWCGIPAPSFRNAMISACRVVGFTMTRAKLSVFVEADGYDADDGTPLVKIEGDPHVHEALVRNETGVADICWRPMWDDWTAMVRVRYDEAQFSATDVVNLMARAGMQVGIGEGRPDSKNSNGMGWGLFEIVGG